MMVDAVTGVDIEVDRDYHSWRTSPARESDGRED